MAEDLIAAGKVVTLKYTLKDDAGKVLEDSGAAGEAYVHGSGNIPSGLEEALEGRRAGDTFSVSLPPEKAFGARKGGGPGPQPIPRATFPEDAALKPGLRFGAETPEGAPISLYICSVEGNRVMVDTLHPFAGMTLCYQVEIIAVRDATGDEGKTGTSG